MLAVAAAPAARHRRAVERVKVRSIDSSRVNRHNQAVRRSLGELLTETRKEAGYSSARDFFRGVGGRGALGCTYAQYLNVEAGRSTPKPALLRAAMALLGLRTNDGRFREIVTAYLRALLKDDDFLELVLTPPSAEAGPLRRALRRNEQSRQVWLTQEQVAAIESDEVTFWCAKVFNNDSGAWGTLELSRLLRHDVKAVRRALDKLAKAGVIVETDNGLYRSFAPDKIVTSPRGELERPENLDLWRRRLEQRQGGIEMYQSLVLRASSRRLREFYPLLAETVIGSDLYHSPERGEDTALYVVEGVVRKMFEF